MPVEFQKHSSPTLHSLSNRFVPLTGLVLILENVLLLQLPHALNLIQINNEALLVPVLWLDALPAKDGQVV